MNSKNKLLLATCIFSVASILGIILTLERYACLWPAFPHFDVFWKVYLDHFMAGFLIPLAIFIIGSGIILLFYRQIDTKTQKIPLFLGFIGTIVLAIIWDFIIPILLIAQNIILNNYGFQNFIPALNLWYLSPRWEFIQFLFDMAGVGFSILFIKFLREDLE